MPDSYAMHESEHAARVLARIRDRIQDAGGWLSFESYMRLALYEPGLGYYSAGARKLGADGDFTTAPEISPLFGRCVARHCAEVLGHLGGGDIVEIGAGSGRLAFDVLTTLAAQGIVPTRYRILEVSADLRERQQRMAARLPPALASCVEWIDTPNVQPWNGALIANEVLDALPVSCFLWRAGELLERGVALDRKGGLRWETALPSPPVREQAGRLLADAAGDWPSGYSSELCLQAGPWIAEVTQSLSRGVALLVDYGLPQRDYYHPRRMRGTLRCHYRHRAHDDPFAHPGLEDITAWVDFTRVADGAANAGLDVLGYTTQAGLLLGLGIEADVANAADENTRIRRASEARRLLMPEEMGESFKAIALGRGYDAPLAGFGPLDLRRML